MHRPIDLRKAASCPHDPFALSSPMHSQSCMGSVFVSPSQRSLLSIRKKFLFARQGDYWAIGYQRHVALLKDSRGLHDLALLLRNPGREFHVCELVEQGVGRPTLLRKDRHITGDGQGSVLSDAGPILDERAKAEYKRRLDDLRRDLEEAERFNDTTRAERDREEVDALAEQLAAAVGLGGRNRRIGSGTERARSAVTKRIKSSIRRIGETIPLLGSHLATRVRTGYFCSYSPHPERSLAWKF